ncbi:SRPBCC domain-containing protein [Paraflavitalea speifideaquila]|uniref:SRPBCC domain-containing protein n=1 Tax=Paraflavitalea speifideaquila TaxID=3076558 RepID=UPI0028E9AC72|nr:SRPBCC domain-containing protein [Paraflavitalea speifideiaquila]
MWAKLMYGAIRQPEYLEITLSFSNEQAGLTRAPFFDNWPMYIRNEFTLTEKGGKTTVTNNSYPLQASPAEVESFLENKASFKGGLTASMERLVEYLASK